MKVSKLVEMLGKLDQDKNVKLIEGEDSDIVDMFGISIQMEEEDLEGEDIILCSEDTLDAFRD